MPSRFHRVFFCFCLLFYPAAAWCHEPGDSKPLIPSGWTLVLGIDGRVLPAFDGSDHYIVRPFPLFSFRPSGTPAHFESPRDGMSYPIFERHGLFAMGPVAKVELPRKESEDAALRGLGDIDWVLELGIYAEFWPRDWLRARIELRRGFHGHHGLFADFSADVVVPVWERWTFSAGPRLTLADDRAMARYFSINPVQSLASGLPIFDAKGGLRSVGVGTQARYQWNPQWETHVYVEYERLMSDAANSPLVVQRGSPDQFTFGVGATYSFDIKLW
jgi:MipA family protein